MQRMHHINSPSYEKHLSPGRSLPMHRRRCSFLTNALRWSDNPYQCTHTIPWRFAVCTLEHQHLTYLVCGTNDIAGCYIHPLCIEAGIIRTIWLRFLHRCVDSLIQSKASVERLGAFIRRLYFHVRISIHAWIYLHDYKSDINTSVCSHIIV